MTDLVTAEKVLTMAVDLEETGRGFYEALALGCGNREMAALCARLAKAEAQHAAVFQEMRKRLPRTDRTKPLTDEQAARVHSMVKDFVIPKPPMVSKVALHGQAKDALAMAIQMERDSVRFYENILRDVQPSQAAAIDDIIRQEKMHLHDLMALGV